MALRATVTSSWSEAAAAWKGERVVALTPFQSFHWLSVWYQTLGRTADLKPIIVTLWRDGAPVALFPLISVPAGRTRVIAFADLGVTDYNAMIWSEAFERNPPIADTIWQLLCDAVAGEGDYIHLTKIARSYDGRPHPIGILEAAEAIEHNTNILRVEGSWELHHRQLPRKFRKELERSWRVLQRDGAPARFVAATSAEEAHEYLIELADHQRRRMKDRSTKYLLDDAHFGDFYAGLITDEAIRSGDVVLTALIARDCEFVAALMGIRLSTSYAMIRLGHNFEEWGHCSPGRTIIERTMAHLHDDRVRNFDFTIGNYGYKDAFNVVQDRLVEIIKPLTLRGQCIVGGHRAKRNLKELMERRPAVKTALHYIRNIAASLVS